MRELGDEVKTRILHGDMRTSRSRTGWSSIPYGELVAITGASGSGKSTLLYLLGALDRPTSGEVLIEGVATSGLDDLARGALRAERLGFVFQFHFLLPELTAVENVDGAHAAPQGPLARRRTPARRGVPWSPWASPTSCPAAPTQLSGGQQQRVSIARAIVNRPAHPAGRRAHRQPGPVRVPRSWASCAWCASAR